MDRNHLLPIAVAAGVHSLLFFPDSKPGISDGPAVAHIAPPPTEVILPPLDPDPPDVVDVADRTAQKPPPPSRPNIPTLEFDPARFTEAVTATDLVPRPPAPDASSIDRDWPSALAGAGHDAMSRLVTCDMLDNHPAARFRPAPLYPAELKPAAADGSAVITFSVDVNGEVFNAAVVRASHTRFGEEALRAVRRWRFEPGIKDGRRVPFRMVQHFTFTLSE